MIRIVRLPLILPLLLLAAGCGDRDDNIPAVNTQPFDDSGAFATSLKTCTYNGGDTEECSLQKLSFLGQEFANPTTNDVMSRVLVSHTWMAENFEAALLRLPTDLLTLFRSVTSIVIASDIRPSFYSSNTGAIYLDPDYLWLNLEQRADVSNEEDFRLAFGQDLQFVMPWRYVKNGQNIRANFNNVNNRSIDSIIEPLAFLLYHELAHAVDYMPADNLASLNLDQSAKTALSQTETHLSYALNNSQGLQSLSLKSLAAVSFLGETATSIQTEILPEDLITEFSPDGATQYYSYSTPREDFATLFETAMISFHFGAVKDTGITNNPGSNANAEDYIVSWGQRGRIAATPIMERAISVTAAVLPEFAAQLESHLRNLPPPQNMLPGEPWIHSLSSTTPSSASSKAQPNGTLIQYLPPDLTPK